MTETIKWHEVSYHEISDEERKENEYPDEWLYYLDCVLPDDGDEILIVTRHNNHYIVDHDECYVDDGWYLDSGTDWIDVIAWAEMPQYKEVTE